MPTRTSDVLARLGIRVLVVACAAIALIAAALALGGLGAASAQESSCEVTDLGTLSSDADGVLEASGRWTTEDCDSRFFTDSDAHTYRFRLAEDGQVRIDLASDEADSYVHLLAAGGGSRIAHDDDTGPGLDSRVEYNLAAGTYLVEAAAGSGRARGAADFTLSIRRAANCEPFDLGELESGADLTASGAWAVSDCGARYREDTPAHTYRFELPEEGLVRIDLTAPEGGDPYLYLLSSDGLYIYSDDDDGGGRNSRIENDLAAGVYLVEATTYGGRDHAHELTDFNLTIRLVDPDTFRLKTEAVHVADRVVAGEPFAVHYRVGNAGHTDLPDANSAVVVMYGQGVYEQSDLVTAEGERWQAGISYHAGEEAASATSGSLSELAPFEITLRRSGPTGVFVGIITFDEFQEETAFHGAWLDFTVLSGWAFDAVTVKVDDADYVVSAEADEHGWVTVSVSSAADPDADVDDAVRAKAIYAAGVRTQVLDGVFERPATAALSTTAEPETVNVANPSSSTLLKAFASQYAVGASGLAESLAAGETVSPVAVEDMMLSTAQTGSARYASLAASWKALQERIEGGEALSFEDAFALQSQLAYAERIIATAVTAGGIVEAARDASMGWQDSEVQAMVSDLRAQASCGDGAAVLRGALDAAGVADADGLLALDAELRAVVPFYGPVNDAALCTAAGVDAANSRFLELLSIAGSAEMRRLLAPEAPVVEPPPLRLRIIAMRTVDARIELGVELAGGEQVLPPMRFVPPDAAVDEWVVSGDVEVDGNSIGQIRARRVADGRIELGFVTADGEEIAPDIRYLPAGPDLPARVWLRSGEIELPRTAASE